MNAEITSTNPAVRAIITGTAPQPARLAAARGILPLPQNDLLEILVALAGGDDEELSKNAHQTLDALPSNELVETVKAGAAAPVLAFFAARDTAAPEIHEAILTNPNTSPAIVSRFARETKNGELLELVSLNQQLLIANPSIIEAIMSNPYRTAEAERRATEIKREFFEKERGAQQIAAELRARGQVAAAEFIETAETELTIEDALFLAEHIEVGDAETDDSWLALEYIEEFYEETEEQKQATISKILFDLKIDGDEEITNERVSMLNRLMKMGIKDRVKLAMKGDREARNILIRDSNRIVAQAVLQNPRISEQEVEKAASMRTVPDEILRQIATSRTWARNYTIAHNLARNPRTPIANVMNILTRLHLRDLAALAKNRNVSDNVRRQALRLVEARSGR